MTNVKRLTEKVGTPTNEKFFNLHFEGARVTRIVGFAGQFLSALTEFYAIFTALSGTFSPLFVWRNLLPLLSALACVYLFEVVGVRVYLIRLVRQITQRELDGLPNKQLFISNLFFVLVLCGSNIVASVLGQDISFDAKVNVTTTDKAFKVDSIKTEKIAALNTDFDKSVSSVNADFDNERKAINADFDSERKAINQRFDELQRTLKDNRFTVRNDKAKYNAVANEIQTAITDKQTALSDLDQRKATALSDLDSRKKSALERIENDRKQQVTDVATTYNARAKDLLSTSVGSQSIWQMVKKYTRYILVLFILLSWIAIIYEEVFYKGAGVPITVETKAKRPNLFLLWFKGVYDMCYLWFYTKIVKTVGVDDFEFSDVKQRKTYIDSLQIANGTPLRTANRSAKKRFSSATNEVHTTGKDEHFNRFLDLAYKEQEANRHAADNQQATSNNQQATTSNTDKQQTPLNVERITLNVGEVNNGQKNCLHCNAPFTAKHWNAKYCGEKCRIDAWQVKTGKTLTKGRKAPTKS
jgi:hypothetical protein